MLNQVSLFTENNEGGLFKITTILAKANINIYTMLANDSAEFGIVRLIVDKAETAIKEDPREERQLIQGHFYTHAVRQFITHLCKNISHSRKNINVSNSALYAMFVHCGLCQQKHCKEKEYLETKVSQAKAILQKGMV